MHGNNNRKHGLLFGRSNAATFAVMQSKYTLLVLLLAVLAFAAGCESDSTPCSVADACVSQCTTECGDAGVISIACTGIVCKCNCGDPGAGGAGGASGTGGAAGSAGAGGTSGAGSG